MSKVKVLHLSTALGLESASYRLHQALRQEGIQSTVGVQSTLLQDSTVIKIATPIETFLAKCNNRLLRLFKPDPKLVFTSYLLPNFVASRIAALQPDIIHLHWISNFLSPWTLKRIAKLNIPVIWTLHDTWAFTGGCHYGTCTHWKEKCFLCPILTQTFNLNVAHIQWRLKRQAYKQLKAHIVTPSLCMMQKVQQSSLLHTAPVFHIPNTLDISTFMPISKHEARTKLGLEQNYLYILFGAMSATSDHNKGYDLLKSALSYLAEKTHLKIHCLIFGASEGEPLPIPSTFLGRLNDPKAIAQAYAAADVFVCPSREENLPNTIMESLACGTPVVGFDIGGIPDMVNHKKHGYIATPYDTQDLAKGMAYILEDENRRQVMGQAARKIVKERYAYPIVAKQYIQLYENILTQHKK